MEWIPVTERLPDPDVRVLVSVKGYDESCIGWCSYDEDDVYWTTEYRLSQRRMEPVTHWMKKPMPFMEETK